MPTSSSENRYLGKHLVANCETDRVAIGRYHPEMADLSMAKWMRDALRHAGMTQPKLAKLMEGHLNRSFDKAAVNKMTLGKRNIRSDEMFAVAEITGFPAPEIASSIIRVPLIDWVEAGKLSTPASQIPVEDVPLLAFADLGRGEFFATRVKGDSMDRVSPEGSIIVVNKSDRTLVANKPYIFAVRGETTFKLWQPADPPYLEPYSFNHMHKPIFVKRKRDLEVIGRVKRTILDL